MLPVLTTPSPGGDNLRRMAEITRVHARKQPRRPHFIAEWAEKRGLIQADIAREIGADKSLVSRWFNGATPSVEYQERLAALFSCEPDSLFRHPDDDWIARFLRGRSADEVERIKAMLEAGFPRMKAAG